MFNISGFLEKFKKHYESDVELRKIVSEVCWDIARIKCDSGQIVFNKNIIYLKVPPLVKNHLLFHRDRILAEFERKIPGQILDIK